MHKPKEKINEAKKTPPNLKSISKPGKESPPKVSTSKEKKK